MRKTAIIAAAIAFTLAGCNGGSGGRSADEDKAKAAKLSKADDVDVSGDDDSSDTGDKPVKKAASSGAGKWEIDTHECSALMDSGDTAIKIQQTDSELKVSFAPVWGADVDESGEVNVSGEQMAYETSDELGHNWLVVTSPNDEFGGLHDVISNAQTIKISYSGGGGTQSQSFSLKGTNGVMDKLLKCAGL